MVFRRVGHADVGAYMLLGVAGDAIGGISRVVASNGEQITDPGIEERLTTVLQRPGLPGRIGPRGAQDRASVPVDAADVVNRQGLTNEFSFPSDV